MLLFESLVEALKMHVHKQAWCPSHPPLCLLPGMCLCSRELQPLDVPTFCCRLCLVGLFVLPLGCVCQSLPSDRAGFGLRILARSYPRHASLLSPSWVASFSSHGGRLDSALRAPVWLLFMRFPTGFSLVEGNFPPPNTLTSLCVIVTDAICFPSLLACVT